MFTGIVEELGTIVDTVPAGGDATDAVRFATIIEALNDPARESI